MAETTATLRAFEDRRAVVHRMAIRDARASTDAHVARMNFMYTKTPTSSIGGSRAVVFEELDALGKVDFIVGNWAKRASSRQAFPWIAEVRFSAAMRDARAHAERGEEGDALRLLDATIGPKPPAERPRWTPARRCHQEVHERLIELETENMRRSIGWAL